MQTEPTEPDGTRSTAFPWSHRLHAASDYGRVFARPLRSADCYFTVLARPNHSEVGRLGLAISRKAAKRAVDRNRLKRLARESFRQRHMPAVDFVVTARGQATAATKPELRKSLDVHFASLVRRLEQRSNG